MILVTGHLGFIGSYLLKELDAYGIDLKNNQDILNCPLPDVDLVIHLAAKTSVIESVLNPIEDARTNILGTIRLAHHYRNTKFIFASSGGAIQETIESPYGLSKFCAEEYIKMICNNYVILRFPNIYGKGSKSVVEKFIEKPVNIWGDGSSTRDYVYVKDLVEAILLAQDWEQGTYSLGTGKSTTVLELAEATGKPITFLDKVQGELQYSNVENTAPNWKHTTNVVEFIKNHV
jgi:UDP-glucose 4-epimerase